MNFTNGKNINNKFLNGKHPIFMFVAVAGATRSTPQSGYKLTGFTVYDKADHAVPFDTDLIESGMEIFFSGYLKNVFAEVEI